MPYYITYDSKILTNIKYRVGLKDWLEENNIWYDLTRIALNHTDGKFHGLTDYDAWSFVNEEDRLMFVFQCKEYRLI